MDTRFRKALPDTHREVAVRKDAICRPGAESWILRRWGWWPPDQFPGLGKREYGRGETKRRTEMVNVDPKGESPILEQLPVAVLRLDARGRCVWANPRAWKVLGLSRDEVAGRGWMSALDEESRGRMATRWEEDRLPEGEKPLSMEVRLAPAEVERVLSLRANPLRDTTGAVTGSLVTLLDVTGWHRTETDLRRTTRRLEFKVRELDCLFEISRAVERSAGDLPTILGDTVDILARTWGHPNPACARISLDGQVVETANYRECHGRRRVAIHVHGEEAGEIRVGWPDPIPDSKSEEGGRLSPSDEERLLETVAQRLGRTTERVKGRRLLREKDEEMRERLTHLTRVSTMGEMASSIAHEVNQPLTAIATYAQACRRFVDQPEPDLPEVSDVLARISSEALRAGNIIHRLKDLVRRQETRWGECDVNDLIRDVEQLASVDARLHDVRIRFELTPDLPTVLADGVQIQQVVLNLIRNGIDAVEEAAPPVREVVVRTGMDGPGRVLISVEDRGCGLPPELEDRLFQPFFTTKKGGMGMGLSICKSIASGHKGRISFKRNERVGMTFHFSLPALDDQ